MSMVKSKSISATYPSSNGFSSGNGNGFCVDSGQEASHGPCTPDDFATAMHAMTISLRALRDSLGTTAFREQLWGTTGFVPPPQPPAPPSPPHPPPSTGSPGLSPHVLATVIAVPVGVCSLLLLLLAVIITNLRRNAKLQRSLLGHVLPPAAGDKATLVITDVQGSSKLWETLPAVVVEASMKLHDDLVRRLALDSSGYEWATEGDSFLLCFHSPQAAITFATQLQSATLPPATTDASASLAHILPLPRPRSAKRLGLRLPTFALPPPKLRATTANGVEDGQGLLGLLTRQPGKEVSNTTFSFCEEEDGMKQASVSDHKESPEQWQPRLDQVRVGWQRLCELYKEVEVEAPAALTVLAGLRGLHTGLAADEVMVQRRMGASSITYGGAALVLAKAVQACAHGGQVTLSAATFVKVGTAKPTAQGKFGDNLPVEELRAAGISVVHMGQHLVALGEGKGATALELYCACLNTPDHAHRLWALGPLRTLRQLQPGVLHAPVRAAAVAFMSVVGLPQLKAWSAELAQECVALYQAAAQRLLLHVSGPQLPAGYWVSSAEEEGMVLAAFPCSLQCLHWALLTLTTCMDMDWPQALLDSASGEEVVIAQAGPSWAAATDSTAAADPPLSAAGEAGDPGASHDTSLRLLRGLRLKAGVDAGEVACDLTPANGRFNYRGRCLNRAARINGLAVSGQVWCSETAWASTLAALHPPWHHLLQTSQPPAQPAGQPRAASKLTSQ
ncbi:nucleotide cyclase [Haematococcus lacustris]